MVHEDDETDYRVVAHVRADGVVREVLCNQPLGDREANLLFILAECVGRPTPVVDLCHRLRLAPVSVRVTATRIRQKLHDDWSIETVTRQGMRLCFIGDALAKADKTKLHLDHAAFLKWRRGARKPR